MAQIENNSTIDEKEHQPSDDPEMIVADSEAIRALYEQKRDENPSVPSESEISFRWLWLPAAALLVLSILFLVMPSERFVVSIIAVALIVSIVLWLGPKWQVRHLNKLEPEELFQQENEARKTLAQIIGGIIVLGGLYYTGENIEIAQQSASEAQQSAAASRELTRQGQITDRFTRAVEQLGKSDVPGKESNIVVRLGGIYALERIANESREDHWSIMELLATYVREYAHRDETKDETTEFGVKADVRAIIRVLGRRKTYDETDQQRLNLGSTDLRGTNFGGTNYNNALFINANLNYAVFADAKFKGASFLGAKLKNAEFLRTDLKGAIFRLSNEGRMPVFDRTNLSGADLTDAKGLNCNDIYDAIIDDATKLPVELKDCKSQ